MSVDQRVHHSDFADVGPSDCSEKPEKGIHLDDFSFLELVEKFVRPNETGDEDIRKYLCNLLLVYKEYHREVEETMFE